MASLDIMFRQIAVLNRITKKGDAGGILPAKASIAMPEVFETIRHGLNNGLEPEEPTVSFPFLERPTNMLSAYSTFNIGNALHLCAATYCQPFALDSHDTRTAETSRWVSAEAIVWRSSTGPLLGTCIVGPIRAYPHATRDEPHIGTPLALSLVPRKQLVSDAEKLGVTFVPNQDFRGAVYTYLHTEGSQNQRYTVRTHIGHNKDLRFDSSRRFRSTQFIGLQQWLDAYETIFRVVEDFNARAQ